MSIPSRFIALVAACLLCNVAAADTAAKKADAPPKKTAVTGPGVRLYALDCGRLEFKDMGFFADTGEYDGTPGKLSDFKGKPLLVNFWATWCVPCIKELPTLDALAARDAGKLQVVLVNEDLEGDRVVAPFLQKHALKNTKPWLDAANALMVPTKVASLPTTILYDANGKEVLRVDRDMDWTGPEAKALLAQVGD